MTVPAVTLTPEASPASGVGASAGLDDALALPTPPVRAGLSVGRLQRGGGLGRAGSAGPGRGVR